MKATGTIKMDPIVSVDTMRMKMQACKMFIFCNLYIFSSPLSILDLSEWIHVLITS